MLDYPVPSAANKYFNPKSAKVRPRHNMMEIVYDTSDWMKSQFFDKNLYLELIEKHMAKENLRRRRLICNLSLRVVK